MTLLSLSYIRLFRMSFFLRVRRLFKFFVFAYRIRGFFSTYEHIFVFVIMICIDKTK